MYELLALALSPLIYLIDSYYFLIFGVIDSKGLSIIILSLSLSSALIPLLNRARKKEHEFNQKLRHVNNEILKNTINLKGEDKFLVTEEIYKTNNYHPIHNLQTGLSFFVLLPILLSAFLFFNINIDKFDTSFLSSIYLSQPDKLLFDFNAIPVLIFFTNYIDSRYRFNAHNSGQNGYLFLSLIICFLIYDMSSCLTIYWLTSSLFSMFFSYTYNAKSDGIYTSLK
jgi:membrane protein insertase Oxa1/YidC/SpoIIIJ